MIVLVLSITISTGGTGSAVVQHIYSHFFNISVGNMFSVLTNSFLTQSQLTQVTVLVVVQAASGGLSYS